MVTQSWLNHPWTSTWNWKLSFFPLGLLNMSQCLLTLLPESPDVNCTPLLTYPNPHSCYGSHCCYGELALLLSQMFIWTCGANFNKLQGSPGEIGGLFVVCITYDTKDYLKSHSFFLQLWSIIPQKCMLVQVSVPQRFWDHVIVEQESFNDVRHTMSCTF